MEKDILLTKGTLRIPCKLTQPDFGNIRRVVLGVHGLTGSARDRIQESIAEEMALFHAATVRFDFPAHGESPVDSGGFSLDNCIASLLAAAEYAKLQYPDVDDLCIFATGFGAYITFLCLDALMELPGNLRLVVQTPSLLMHDTLLSMGRTTETAFRAMDLLTFRTQRPLEISYSFYEDMKWNVALNSYPLPFLILHGEQDDFIPMEQIQHLRRINDQAKLVIIPGASHQFLEEGAWDMVLDLTRDWFEFQQVLVSDWE